MEKHSTKPDVAPHVEALLGRIGDTLSNREIFEELEGVLEDGVTFVEVFADVNDPPAQGSI